jgi:CIC family chloride channel protein
VRLPRPQPETLFLFLAAAVGAAGALGNFAFRKAIGFSHEFFHGGTQDLLSPLGLGGKHLLIVLVPVLGGLAVGALARISKREVGGYAMPSFLEAVNLRAARLSLRLIFLRTLAAVITLGSGGSAGVEGPIASLGGGIGAGVARARRLVGERLRLLIACGSSAAIAAAYGAPIAGVFFTQEIVLAGNYDLQNFVRVVVASGTATVVARALRGDEPLFQVEPFELASANELVFYILLGLGCGVVGVFFARVFHWTRELFNSSRIPEFYKPGVGGLIVGLLALASPGVLGDGAELMQTLLEEKTYPGSTFLLLMLALLAAKILATSVTIGSGGAGGVFGPSLFLGAVLGVGVGALAVRIAPEWSGMPGHYAIVGMGALLAATARAPLTSIFLVFEMTGSSSTAVLPTLMAVAGALFVARRLEPDSIDEMELSKRGIQLKAGRDISTLGGVTAADAMNPEFEQVLAKTPAPELLRLVNDSRSNVFVVTEDDGSMAGLLTVQDLRILDQKTVAELGHLTIASDLMERNVISVFTDESLAESLGRMDQHGFRQLPVVERSDSRRVVGILARRHIITAYRRALTTRPPAE